MGLSILNKDTGIPVNSSDGSKSLTYPSTEEESAISATLQTELRTIMTEAGLTVSNSKCKNAKRRQVRSYWFKCYCDGNHSGFGPGFGWFGELLVSFIESLNVYPNRKNNAVQTNYRQTVTARFKLTSLRMVQ